MTVEFKSDVARLSYVRQHGRIRRSEVMGLCRLSEGQAKELLKRLKERGDLLQRGERRGTYYTLGEVAPDLDPGR
ncbi:hypothetical protein [Cupriavidus sp. 8B]